MNSELVLEFLPINKEDAKSMDEIAQAMGLDISSYTSSARTKRQLARALRSLVKWGRVACDKRQSEVGYKSWHNAYWKI